MGLGLTHYGTAGHLRLQGTYSDLPSLAPAAPPQGFACVWHFSTPGGMVLWGALELSLKVQIPKPPGKHLLSTWKFANGEDMAKAICSDQRLPVTSLAFSANGPDS